MERNIIFYFSGTGNCLQVAKNIATSLENTELVFIKDTYQIKGHYERVGFVFPSYAMGIPKRVLQFIRELNLSEDITQYIFSVVTCNRGSGNCLAELQTELKKKGMSLQYGETLQMVGNNITLYDIPKNKEQLLEEAEQKGQYMSKNIILKIKNDIPRKQLVDTVYTAIGNQFFKAKEKQFVASNECIGCGTCEKLCPVSNIEMKNGKPIFLHNGCMNCLACMHWCPKKAINCGKTTQSRSRYHHPQVTLKEMLMTGKMTSEDKQHLI